MLVERDVVPIRLRQLSGQRLLAGFDGGLLRVEFLPRHGGLPLVVCVDLTAGICQDALFLVVGLRGCQLGVSQVIGFLPLGVECSHPRFYLLDLEPGIILGPLGHCVLLSAHRVEPTRQRIRLRLGRDKRFALRAKHMLPFLAQRLDRLHVVLRFADRGNAAVFAHIAGSSVVGSGGQIERFESLMLLLEIQHAAPNVVVQVIDVDAQLPSRARHQLHDAKRSCGRRGKLVEARFLLGDGQRKSGVDFFRARGFQHDGCNSPLGVGELGRGQCRFTRTALDAVEKRLCGLAWRTGNLLDGQLTAAHFLQLQNFGVQHASVF